MEDFRSFVLVQYKRCRIESGLPVYRPDEQFRKEVERLTVLESVEREASEELAELRLGEPFCFAKLCDPRQPLLASLSVGMYFDFHCFRLLATPGVRQGLRIVYREVPRYITNTTFTELVSHGWVGSSGKQSEAVIAAMEEGLKENRCVFLASIRLGANRNGRASAGAVRARGFTLP